MESGGLKVKKTFPDTFLPPLVALTTGFFVGGRVVVFTIKLG